MPTPARQYPDTQDGQDQARDDASANDAYWRSKGFVPLDELEPDDLAEAQRSSAYTVRWFATDVSNDNGPPRVVEIEWAYVAPARPRQRAAPRGRAPTTDAQVERAAKRDANAERQRLLAAGWFPRASATPAQIRENDANPDRDEADYETVYNAGDAMEPLGIETWFWPAPSGAQPRQGRPAPRSRSRAPRSTLGDPRYTFAGAAYPGAIPPVLDADTLEADSLAAILTASNWIRLDGISYDDVKAMRADPTYREQYFFTSVRGNDRFDPLLEEMWGWPASGARPARPARRAPAPRRRAPAAPRRAPPRTMRASLPVRRAPARATAIPQPRRPAPLRAQSRAPQRPGTFSQVIRREAQATGRDVTNDAIRLAENSLRDWAGKQLRDVLRTRDRAPMDEIPETYDPPADPNELPDDPADGWHNQQVEGPDGITYEVNVPDSIPDIGYPMPYEDLAQQLAERSITQGTTGGIDAIADYAAEDSLAALAGEFDGIAALDAYAGAADVFAAAEAANAALAFADVGGLAAGLDLGAAAAGGVEAALAAVPGWGWAAAAALTLLGGKLFKHGGPKPRQFGVVDNGTALQLSQSDYLQGFDDLWGEASGNLFPPGQYDRAAAAPELGFRPVGPDPVATLAGSLKRLEPYRLKPFPAEWFADWAIRAHARTNPAPQEWPVSATIAQDAYASDAPCWNCG